ncbi:MAG: hypothetical protein ACTHJT_12620 [Cytophaga sp.]|uniref:hypothetical protein n=1 Tax=Cytophaga sp. TaxID=29535 RepID=UPI003F7F4A23
MFRETLPTNKTCPPLTAIEKDIILFRIFQENVISEDEFRPHTKLYPNNPQYKKQCVAHAVSLYKTYDQALAKYKEMLTEKNKKMGNFIAELVIKKQHGKIDITEKTGHCNLWIYSEAELLKIETRSIVAIEEE